MSVRGMWTRAELTEALGLAQACEATDERWKFADWLLGKDGGGAYDHSSTGPRLVALEAKLGWPFGTLRRMRQTAYAWPPEYRVPNASFSAHEHYRTGGPDAAADRATKLAARPRTALGRIPSQRAKSESFSLTVGPETHAAVRIEAVATGLTLKDTAADLIAEALQARAWLASEVAA